MVEIEYINMGTLHLDGEANEWWFHGMKTNGHDKLTIYEEFTKRLTEIFERRDSETPFRELAHMKQIGTPEDSISNFQNLALLVTGISEACLILLFIEGLEDPLKGLVKAY